MKKVFIFSLVFFFFLGTNALAQDTPEPEHPEGEQAPYGAGSTVRGEAELPDAGLTPDSPFYFLETIVEGIGTFFTFGDVKKAERYAGLAAERLAEAQAVVEKGKPELAEKTLERYEMQLNKSMARAEKAVAKGKSAEKVIEVVGKVRKATSAHLEVLAEVYEKVPEQAKPAIEKAMKVSVKGHEKAVEVLREKDALGEVPEAVSLPAKVPKEVRERIQRNAQKELEIEKAVKCVAGDCLQYQSFKELEAKCREEGGAPELCASLKAKCKEFGITTPGECYRALTVSRIESGPAPSLSEEEMEERRRGEEKWN